MPAVTPTQGKFGPASVLFLLAGYNLLAAKVQNLRYKIEALQEQSDGLGDGWEEHTPNGKQRAELVQEGAFWDTAAGNIHEALAAEASAGLNPQSAPKVACVGLAGNAIGQPLTGIVGTYTQEYEVLAQRAGLTKANAAYAVNGQAEQGAILHALGTETSDPSNTEATSVDNTRVPQRTVPITSSATNEQITTPVPHGLVAGDSVLISGHSGSTPSINGEFTVASVQSPTVFTITGVDITVGGTGGSFVKGKTASGGAGYLQVESVTLGGFTNVLFKVRHSADDSVFADLLSFAVVTARTAERVAVAGTVNRYLAASADFQGAGSGQSVRYLMGFARN